MKRCFCATLLLLLLFAIETTAPAAATFGDFNAKAASSNQAIKQIRDFGTDLKLQAELNSELEQGLLKINAEDKYPFTGNDRNAYNYDSALDSPNFSDAQPAYVGNFLDSSGLLLADTQQYSSDNNNDNLISNNNDHNVEVAIGEKSPRKSSAQPRRSEKNSAFSDGEIRDFVGTNLFDGCRKTCFSSEDIALMTARRDFEMLIPKDLPVELFTDEMVGVLMRYFYNSNSVVHRAAHDETARRLVEKAFYDMLGGYLRYYIVPLTKYSFYAGKVCLKTVESVVQLYDQCKCFLNTNGNGWRGPMGNIQDAVQGSKIEPVRFDGDCEEGTTACVRLMLESSDNDPEDEQMIVPLPKLSTEDCNSQLSSIWLPFKKKSTYDLRSSKSANIILKFYETVTQCYRYQSIPQATFNSRFKSWIFENIQVHLSDEQFYPGLGGVLRLYEGLKRGKKDVVLDGAKVPEIAADDIFGSNNNYEDEELTDVEDDEDTGLTAGKQQSDVMKLFESPISGLKTKRNQMDADYGVISGRGAPAGAAKHCGPEDKAKEKEKEAPAKPHCKKRPKKKKKPKCKPHPGPPHIPHPGGKEKQPPAATGGFLDKLKGMLPTNLLQQIQSFFSTYYIYFLFILLLILLLLLCFLLFNWYRKRKGGRQDSVHKKAPPRPKAQPDGAKPQKKNWFSWCPCIKRQTADEHIHVRPQSKSVISTKSNKLFMNTSSSSLLCEPTRSCLPFYKAEDDSCSDQEQPKESAKSKAKKKAEPKKSKQKVVTINEKKNTVSPKKFGFRRKSKTESSNNNKFNSSPSRSWETISSTLKGSTKEPAHETESFEFTTSDEESCKKKTSVTTDSIMSARSLLSTMTSKDDARMDDFCRWKRYGLQPSTQPKDESSTSTYADVRVDHMKRMNRFGIRRSCKPGARDADKPRPSTPPTSPRSSQTKTKSVSDPSQKSDKSPLKFMRIPDFLKKYRGDEECVTHPPNKSEDQMRRVGIQRHSLPDCSKK